VLPETEPESAAVFAERTRASLEQEEFVIDGTRITLTISLGVAGITAAGGITDTEILMKAADDALYGAKNGGRNRYVRAPDIEGKSINHNNKAA